MWLRNLFCAGAVALLAGCVSSPQGATASANSAAPARPPSEAPPENESIADAHAHYSAGIVHELEGDANLALRDFYAAALKDPGDDSLILEVSGKFLDAKQTEKALDILQRAASRPGASAEVLARLSFAFGRLGRHAQAIRAAQDAVRKQPRFLAGWQNLFFNYTQSNQIAEAVATLNRAAATPGVDARFLIGLAQLYLNAGLQAPAQKTNTDAAGLRALEQASSLGVSNTSLQLQMADAFFDFGKTSRAAGIYEDLLKRLSDDPAAMDTLRARLADIYLQGKNSGGAARQLEALVRDNPTDARAWYFLGSLASDATNYEAAGEDFNKTLLLDPGFEPAYYDLASVDLDQNKTNEALGILEKARKRFSQNFVMEYLTGATYSRLEDFTNALAHFTSAEIVANASEPKQLTAQFYFQIGAASERTGHPAEAAKYFEKCLGLSPDNAEAQNYLGYMWADRGENLDRARDLIQKAVAAEPKNAAYLDSMAWVLFKLNQPRPALDYELKAVQFSDQPDADIYNHLGDIYAGMGNQAKAREAWSKSLSLESNPGVKKKLESVK